jgi:hypothetical protein
MNYDYAGNSIISSGVIHASLADASVPEPRYNRKPAPGKHEQHKTNCKHHVPNEIEASRRMMAMAGYRSES